MTEDILVNVTPRETRVAVVENGMILMGVSPYIQQVVKGLIIVGAVVYDMRRNKRR